MASTTDLLLYADPPRQKQRGGFRRWAIGIGIAVVVACAYFRFHDSVTHPFRRLQIQRRAAADGRAPSFVLCREFAGESGRRAGYYEQVAAWNRFADEFGVRDRGTILFLGRLHTPGDLERIVIVTNMGNWMRGGGEARTIAFSRVVQTRIMTPATFFDPPRAISRAVATTGFVFPSIDYQSVYSGQSDPSDPAAFTLRVEHDGKTSIFRGRLNADADAVVWTVASGPAEVVQDAGLMSW